MNGNDLQKMIELLGVSQEEFGLIVGRTRETIYQWRQKGDEDLDDSVAMLCQAGFISILYDGIPLSKHFTGIKHVVLTHWIHRVQVMINEMWVDEFDRVLFEPVQEALEGWECPLWMDGYMDQVCAWMAGFFVSTTVDMLHKYKQQVENMTLDSVLGSTRENAGRLN
jgi:hypothetical protein